MTTTTATITDAFNRYIATSIDLEFAEDLALKNPDDEELEQAWDDAYTVHFAAYAELVTLIVETMKPHAPCFTTKHAAMLIADAVDHRTVTRFADALDKIRAA